MRRSLGPPGETELSFRFHPPFLPNRHPLLRAKLGNPNTYANTLALLGGAQGREREADDEPASRRIGGLDRRSVGVRALRHDGQAGPRALPPPPVRSAEEAVEELPELLLGGARTMVADLEHAVAQPDL